MFQSSAVFFLGFGAVSLYICSKFFFSLSIIIRYNDFFGGKKKEKKMKLKDLSEDEEAERENQVL